ncbi:hypothetical protein Tco_1092762 [Tanacetum coccineum]|uniref:Uncharacterized protein n=1 Tax=Tanacetum coccineum TaxID=301880 RepID=A0ABQ5IC18_9ASTR
MLLGILISRVTFLWSNITLLEFSRQPLKSSDSRTLNVNVICAECGKCVFNSNHDACVSKYLNDVNARTKKPKVMLISASKPKRKMNKRMEWLIEKKCPSEYKWTQTTPSRPSLKWKPTGRIFSNVRLRWVPTGKLFNSCTGKNGFTKDELHHMASAENNTSGLVPHLMTSVHISSGLVLHQMTSDHNRSELGIHNHSNELSSSKLVPKSCSLSKQDSYITTRVGITIPPSHSNVEDNSHKVVRLGINPMIQPEPEDLPKDNPKLEIAVLRLIINLRNFIDQETNSLPIQDGRVYVQPSSGERQGQVFCNGYKSNATSSGGNNASGQQGLLNATTVKVKDIWLGNALSLRKENQGMNMTEDLDTYDSDCDDISNAKAVLMANISNYGSDVISEEKANKEQNNESVTAELERYKERVKTFKQRLNIDLSREKMIDSQMDDMIKEKLALKEKLTLLEQNLSKKFKKKECLLANQSIKPSIASPVKIEAPKELPKVSLVNERLKKLKFHLARFDNVVKIRTTPDARIEDLLNEIMEVHIVFDQMDAAVQQSSVDKQCLEIAKK